MPGYHPVGIRLLGSIIAAVCLASLPVSAQPSVSREAVEKHALLLRRTLLRSQLPAGSWSGGRYELGTTALVVLALKQAGLPNEHPVIRKAVDYLVQNTDGTVYSESLVITALEKVDPLAHRRRIEESVRTLVDAQTPGGAWSYSRGRRLDHHDNSNTQFAVLGLAAARRCGVKVPELVRRRALKHWLQSQNSDGGWCYRDSGASSLSMTCAGIASLYLLGRVYEKPGSRCGEYKYDSDLKQALAAMRQQVASGGYGATRGHGSYALYAVERVGMFLDLKELDGLDWYRWGADWIIRQGAERPTHDLAFDLLFLEKGEARVAIAKWQFRGDWNNDHLAVKNWVTLGSKELGLKLDWTPARLGEPGTSAARASMIFVSGHGPFVGTKVEASFLRKFLSNHGSLVAEGCCNQKLFIDSFQEFIRTQLYPDTATEFVPVDDDHPVCGQKYDLSAAEVSALQVRTGCHRRRILILTRDISCPLNGEPCSPEELERSKKVSINLLQWAMKARAPRSKLTDVELEPLEDSTFQLQDDAAQFPRPLATRKLRQAFGRLVHRGEWDVDLSLFPTLREALAGHPGVPRLDGEVLVKPTSGDLFGCALLYISGHDDLRLRREEWLPLRTYLQNGGTIVATACCGMESFDRGFRRLMGTVLPNDRLDPIPPEDPVWNSPFPRNDIPVRGTKKFMQRHGQKLAPLHGIRREGRWIVLYSEVDLCCDLEGDLEEDTVAYKRATSVPLWINLLHSVFTP